MFNWLNKEQYKIITIISILIFSVAIYGNAVGGDGISKERQDAFKEIIQPWIKVWFVKHAVEISLSDNIKVERKLVSSTLYRFEKIDGQERYSVNILYHVAIYDSPSEFSISGLKEQQVVFLLDGKDMIDYFPFAEYWKEKPTEKSEDLHA